MKRIIIITAVILMPAIAFASFSIRLDNDTGKKMFYLLYWIDHTFDWPQPFNLAGGELEASEAIDLKANYQKGKYYVVWYDNGDWQNKVMMNVNGDIKAVIVTPIKCRMGK
jgi:hypothetical protein